MLLLDPMRCKMVRVVYRAYKKKNPCVCVKQDSSLKRLKSLVPELEKLWECKIVVRRVLEVY